MARRDRRRHGARRGAHGDIAAHVKSLGFPSEAEYRAWRRMHGLSGAAALTWGERSEERALHRKHAEEAQVEARMPEHIEALGLPSVEAYERWRSAHGFGPGRATTRAQVGRELRTAARLRADVALVSARRMTTKPMRTIQRLHERELPRDAMPTPAFTKIHDAFTAADARLGARGALYAILGQAERRGDLLSLEAAVPQFGDAPGNTYIDGMLALALRHEAWVRPATDWQPGSHNSRRQFASLARHLLARYDVPGFMDSVWFRGVGPVGRSRQDWFVRVAAGTNIRKVDGLPLRLTKRMAHLLMQAPRWFTVDQALRWAQVVGMNGSEALAEAVVATRIGGSFRDEEFWQSVVEFLVYNPMLDPRCADSIVAYIHEQKYEPRQIACDDGRLIQAGPPHPRFSMRTRKVGALLAEVDEWREEREREKREREEQAAQSWGPSGIDAYELVETDESETTRWSISELTTVSALATEGQSMRHCVTSYAQSCRRGRQSIWSLQAEDDEGETRRVLTIAVKNRPRKVTQVRGKSNAHPLGGHRGPQHRTRIREGYRVMCQWAAEAGIGVPKHI